MRPQGEKELLPRRTNWNMKIRARNHKGMAAMTRAETTMSSRLRACTAKTSATIASPTGSTNHSPAKYPPRFTRAPTTRRTSATHGRARFHGCRARGRLFNSSPAGGEGAGQRGGFEADTD